MNLLALRCVLYIYLLREQNLAEMEREDGVKELKMKDGMFIPDIRIACTKADMLY